MSQSNPEKKKQRVAKHTILVYGEGPNDKIFLEHLRGIYARNSNVKVTIRSGKGGSPKEIVTAAIKEMGAFDQRTVVIDNDKGAKEMKEARGMAEKNSIKVIENTPCLEATLLATVDPSTSHQNKTSAKCKKEFQAKYIPKKERRNKEEYKKHFPKETLEKRRESVEDLNTLISLFEPQK